MPDLPAIEDIGRLVHDSLFRAMLADPARANGLIRAHWPRQLRWLLEGAPARPVDSTLIRDDLRQFRTDTLFLVGGEGSRPNALFLPEHKFGAVARTPWQLRDYARTVLDGLDLADSLWLVSMVFDTGGDGGWNVLGAVDETSDNPLEILVQMRRDSAYFARQTRRIRYGNLSCEAVSRAMLGMMGLAGRRPYPRDLLARMWREDVAGRVAGLPLPKLMLTFALATSDLAAEELLDLALETGLVDRELEMGVITQPLILDAVERGMAEGRAKGMAEGKAEGMAGLLLHQCRQRFGAIPKDAELRVRSAPLCDLEAWAGSILQARSLDEVFRNGKSG